MLNDPGLLALAAFAAGALNAVAGGGSFLTLPALMAAGVTPVAANATGTVALLPGYVGATLGGRRDLQAPSGWSLPGLGMLALCGGALGAGLLLLTPDRLFAALAPGLLLLATMLFALQPWLRQRSASRRTAPWRMGLGLFAVCVYGGYFNGGLGILLLAVLGSAGIEPLSRANALKNLLSAILTAIAVALYLAGGAVLLGHALWMMLFAALGGYLGARLGRRLPPALLRTAIIGIGLTMSVQLLRS